MNNGTLNVTGGGAIFSDTSVDDGTLSLNGGLFFGNMLTVGDGIGGPATALAESLAPGQLAGGATAVTVKSDGKLNAFSDTVLSLDVTEGAVDTGAAGTGLVVTGAVTLEGGTIGGSSLLSTVGALVTVNPSAGSSTISAPFAM